MFCFDIGIWLVHIYIMKNMEIKKAQFTFKWFKKNQSNDYQSITNFLENNSFLNGSKENKIIWHWFHNVNYQILCNNCNLKEPHFNGKSEGYRKYCSRKCQAASIEVRENRENSNIKKFGTKHALQNKEIYNKMKNTFLEKYGVENAYQIEDVKEKIKETNLKRYGVDYPMKNEIMKERQQKNLKEKNLEKYGVENVFQTMKVKEKIKSTNLERYGQENHLSFKYKDYIFSSGRIVKVQGYEKYAIDLLLKEYTETDILVGKEVNRLFKFYYIFNNKKCRYYPDIYIKSKNKIIEVKSRYTYVKNLEKNKAKKECIIKKNINFDFMIITPNKKRNPTDFKIENA